MKRGSTRAIALGLLALLASWAFGSTPLAVVGIGLGLAGVLARTWARLAHTSIAVERRLRPGERLEGADVVVEISIRDHGRLLGGAAVARQRLGEIERETRVNSTDASMVFAALPRGRHVLEPLHLELTDPMGLERIEQRLGERSSVLIRPRVPVLPSVLSIHGSRETGSARSSFRGPAGFEIHAVREYAPGEPLRAVHWPSTARRGRLMVKELDDAPRDDLVVLLDQDLAGVAGPAGRSSFDAAVRAAGAIVLAHASWNRSVVLAGTDPLTEPVRVRSTGLDWEVALDALAAAEPVPGALVDHALRSPIAGVSHAREIVVVTGRPERAVDGLLELRRNGRSVSLVVVAAETFAGRPRSRPEPTVLKAAAYGVPVAVVTAETSIEDALAGGRESARHA